METGAFVNTGFLLGGGLVGGGFLGGGLEGGVLFFETLESFVGGGLVGGNFAVVDLLEEGLVADLLWVAPDRLSAENKAEFIPEKRAEAVVDGGGIL